MKTRESKRRIAVVTAILLIAAAAGGVITWQNLDKKKENQMASGEETQEMISENIGEDDAVAEHSDSDDAVQPEETIQPDSEETSGNAQGQMETTEETAAEPQPEQTGEPQNTEESQETAAAPQIALDFSESTVLQSPVSGQILIPYNMESTVYFPTLNVYKCNPSVVISAEVGAQVTAVANSQVKSIQNDPQTGLTVTMDMGNGYEAVYGQLKDVALEEGATVEQGAVIGTVAEPTKYYTEEGSNLYFALSKDGQVLDPSLYLPPQAE